MKLITERIDEVNYITEAKEDGTKKFYIEGVFLQSAIKNRNGRIYPEEVMDKEVARYIKESVQNNTALGELNHPNGPQINLDRVSHRIMSLNKEGKNYIGKAVIADTPMGNIAKGIMECGGKLGVSSRGMGTVKPNKSGINEVQGDFRLATAADIVADPSAPDAWVNGIMEGVEFFWDENANGYKVMDANEWAKQQINEAVKTKKLGEQKVQLFANYLNKLARPL